MVSFRPHTLTLLRKGGGSYNANGDWEEAAPAGELVSVPCRYEPNGGAGTVTLEDGSVYRYSYMVYLSVNPALDIKYGDMIRLTSQDGVDIGEYSVRGFHRGQLDMKVWV